jgi:SAM-dependent methyltransferase
MATLPDVTIDSLVSGASMCFPSAWPFSPADFSREDESPDATFYICPRLVHHVDPAARYALKLFYSEVFDTEPRLETPDVLDLCASWASHLPDHRDLGSVVGIGMNSAELAQNGRLTSFSEHDLNSSPVIAIPADAGIGAFDFVTCALSIDYLVRPKEVLAEALRLLRPGGACIISFSNRMFPTKAIRAWVHATDAQRVWIAAAFLHFARVPGWRFSDITAIDLSPDPGRSDPLYIVRGTKTQDETASGLS